MPIKKITLGLIINPVAGLGGSVALKGSDGFDVLTEAWARGADPRAYQRIHRAFLPLGSVAENFTLAGFSGAMGGDLAAELGLAFTSVGQAEQPSGASDTRRAAEALLALGVDLIVFAGGDGTARDIADVVQTQVPVLGVPAGVKMHSGVFAITPEAASRVLLRLTRGQWAPLQRAEVRDIDEVAFRAGQVRTRHYGEMLVPEAPVDMQLTKTSGLVPDALAQLDVAAECIEQMGGQTLYLVGPGSTTRILLEEMGLEASLLGIDIVLGGEHLVADATATDIRNALAAHHGAVNIIVTAIGGQGHIFGRGNQQLGADVIARVGRKGIKIIATADKIKALNGRPLLVDTNDPVLDQALAGLYPVITGYHQRIVYPVGLSPAEMPDEVGI